jgi:hypothetical protein
MRAVVKKVAYVAAALSVFHLGYGAFTAFRVIQGLLAGQNLMNFVLYTSILTATLATRILPSLSNLWAASHQPADLEKKITDATTVETKAGALANALVPSLIADKSGTTPPAEPLTERQKVALYAVQFFNLLVKASIVAIPLATAPLPMFVGMIAGYCVEDFIGEQVEEVDNFQRSIGMPVYAPNKPEELGYEWQRPPVSMPSLTKQMSLLNDHLFKLFQYVAFGAFGRAWCGFAAGQALRYYTKGATWLPEKTLVPVPTAGELQFPPAGAAETR